jgi:corrinoid protein of di/trimethylamine methyltransferase
MVTRQEEENLLCQLKRAVIEFDEEQVEKLVKEWLDKGLSAGKAIFEGLVPGIEEVGRLYEEQVYFIPEMLLCADALYKGLELLKDRLDKKDLGVRGTVLIGVVEGDIHDIGKNIVKIMFENANFEVYDLGRDVPLENFLNLYEQLRPDIVCLSTMMTTTMMEMRRVIVRLKESNPDVKVMIGGAPVTQDIASRFGASGYAENATRALKVAVDILLAIRDDPILKAAFYG